MQITRAGRFADVYVLTPPVYSDERGFFMESCQIPVGGLYT